MAFPENKDLLDTSFQVSSHYRTDLKQPHFFFEIDGLKMRPKQVPAKACTASQFRAQDQTLPSPYNLKKTTKYNQSVIIDSHMPLNALLLPGKKSTMQPTLCIQSVISFGNLPSLSADKYKHCGYADRIPTYGYAVKNSSTQQSTRRGNCPCDLFCTTTLMSHKESQNRSC